MQPYHQPMTPPATVTLIAAVFGPPQRGELIVAGTERIHSQRDFCNVTFFHLLRATKQEHLDVTGGEVVHVTANLTPHPELHGRVQLDIMDLKVIGTTTDRNKQGSGFQATFGYTLVTAQGVIASPPRRLTFDDGELLTNFVLRLPGARGLIECSAYSLTAHAAAQFQQGEHVRLQGRLLSRKRPAGDGRWHVYSKLELPRQQTEALKVRPALAAAQ